MGHPQAGRFRLRGIARAGTAQAAGIAADWHRVAKHFLFQPRVVGSQDRCLSGERTAGPGGGRPVTEGKALSWEGPPGGIS